MLEQKRQIDKYQKGRSEFSISLSMIILNHKIFCFKLAIHACSTEPLWTFKEPGAPTLNTNNLIVSLISDAISCNYKQWYHYLSICNLTSQPCPDGQFLEGNFGKQVNIWYHLRLNVVKFVEIKKLMIKTTVFNQVCDLDFVINLWECWCNSHNV